VITDDPEGGQIFEIVQKMSDPALTMHNGLPVRRVIQTPNVATKHTSAQEKSRLSNKNLERMGFTKYEKSDDGKYVRTAGKEGPKTFNT
jgi:hypothetical protein